MSTRGISSTHSGLRTSSCARPAGALPGALPRACPARTPSRGSTKPLVVLPPLLLIRQDFVGLLDLLEALLGLGVFWVCVRVVFPHQLAVCLLDVVLGGLPG